MNSTAASEIGDMSIPRADPLEIAPEILKLLVPDGGSDAVFPLLSVAIALYWCTEPKGKGPPVHLQGDDAHEASIFPSSIISIL